MNDEKAANREKWRSIAVRVREPAPKTTTDVHDTHSVDVVEHWNDRVDVTVKPDPIHIKVSQEG